MLIEILEEKHTKLVKIQLLRGKTKYNGKKNTKKVIYEQQTQQQTIVAIAVRKIQLMKFVSGVFSGKVKTIIIKSAEKLL